MGRIAAGLRPGEVGRGLCLVGLVMLCASCSSPTARRAGPPVSTLVDMPAIAVQATYAGAGVDELEALVARPLEDALCSVEGVAATFTRCEQGACTVLLAFERGQDVDRLAGRVHSAVDRVTAQLPEDVKTRCCLHNPLRAPDLALAVVAAGGASDARQIEAAKELVLRLEGLPCVAQCKVVDHLGTEVQVVIDRAKAANLRLMLSDVAEAVQKYHAARRGKAAGGGEFEVVIPGLDEAAELGDLVIRRDDTGVVRLKDVAQVKRQRARATSHRIDGRRAVLVHVFLRTRGNGQGIDVFRRAMSRLKLPPGVREVVLLSEGLTPFRKGTGTR